MTSKSVIEELVTEMGEAANFWVDPSGKAFSTGLQGHVDWAARHLGIKLPKFSQGQGYWEVQGQIYQKMFSRGWLRVAVQHAKNQMLIDPGRMSSGQAVWVTDKAMEDQLRVVDDGDNEIMDCRAAS